MSGRQNEVKNVVSHTAVEQPIGKVQASRDWDDVARRFVPPEENYIAGGLIGRAIGRFDRRRRLDHIWVTPDISAHVKNYAVLREAVLGRGPPTMHRFISTRMIGATGEFSRQIFIAVSAYADERF